MTGGLQVASPGPGELLEREAALALLESALGEAEAGSGRLVLVAGEAGVGKTALLRRFCAARSERTRTLWGFCEPLRTPRPLGPLLDVAGAVGGTLERLALAGARPHEVAAALLDELRRDGPTVLVLEDVHWADEATLDVLTMLATRVESAPALVLASYRDDQLERDDRLRLVLGELVRRPARLKLDPLSPDAVAGLARPHGVDPGTLYRRTGGNPFFVVEALAATGEAIPQTVRDAVLARAARLSPRARGLLDALAIVPGHVESPLVEALAASLADRVEECLASGILVAGETYVAFRHELARLAIEEALPPTRRAALNRAALEAIAAGDGDPARLAHHASAAGDVDAVLRWAPLAGERAAASGAHRDAAAQYERALRVADALPLEARAELLQRRADACWMSAQFDDAIAAQQAALDCRRQLGDRLEEGDALRLLSRLHFFAGHGDAGEPIALEAVEALERLPAGRELAMAYGNLSQRRMSVEDAEEAAAWGRRALALARRLGDAESTVYALTNLGATELQRGARGGQQKLERALVLAQQHGLEDHAGRIFSNLVMWNLRHRRLDLAGADLEARLEFCRERGLDTWRLYLLASRARLELAAGRFSEAVESAAAVLRDPRSAWVARASALVAVGVVRARRGEAGASEPLSEAESLAGSAGELVESAAVAAACAEAAWLVGEVEAVEELTSSTLARARDRRAAWLVGELAYWRRQAGLRDELPVVELGGPYRLALAGEWTKAAARWRRLGCPYEAALALAETDDRTLALQALAELEALGAVAAVEAVSRRLRRRGVAAVPRGPRASTLANPAGLTARELEVLALVAEGLRNAEIAARLVVSVKTVDHHVGAILRKLGVRSRAEAAAAAVRGGFAEGAAPR